MKKVCKNCAFWNMDLEDGSNYRECVIARSIRIMDDSPRNGFRIIGDHEGDADIVTGPEFGCVHWEEKP